MGVVSMTIPGVTYTATADEGRAGEVLRADLAAAERRNDALIALGRWVA
jgi:hypothetical protein